MLTRSGMERREQMGFFCMEELVPAEHVLRAVEEAIDFEFIYEAVSGLYCEDNGRPTIDPVVLFKVVFIQYIFGLRSMRQTIREIEVNVAYRWFLGFDLYTPVPHFTTFGKNYQRRFADSDVFEKIFERILQEAEAAGFVDASAVFIDGTHIKANANKKKCSYEVVKKQARHYKKELDAEMKRDREEHGKKAMKDDDDEPPEAPVAKSTTDPDCGMFHKGEHEKQLAYTAHVACDKHNFVLACEIAPGNVHDSVMFDELYGQVIGKFPEIGMVALDSGYKTPWIMKQVFDSGRLPATPYKSPMTKKGFFKKYEFVYDEYYDCVLCPNDEILPYSTTNRGGYREYKSTPATCQSCPHRTRCTQSKACQKVVTRHIWQDYLDRAEDVRHSPQGKAIYTMRGQTIERVFADAKDKHALRYTQYRSKPKVKMEILLTFAAMNLKKLAIWKKRISLARLSSALHPIPSLFPCFFSLFFPFFAQKRQLAQR